MASNAWIVALGLVVALFFFGAIAYVAETNNSGYAQLLNSTPSTTIVPPNKTAIAPILLTDPPSLPVGTTSLVVSYSNLSVYISGKGSPRWVNATGRGLNNLLIFQNQSVVIGYANLTLNATISAMRYQIDSVEINVYGDTYPVTIPVNASNVTAEITGSTNGSYNVTSITSILLSMMPTVSGYSVNGTSNYTLTAVQSRLALIANRSVTASARAGIGTILGVSANGQGIISIS